jgi:hypothetical protein
MNHATQAASKYLLTGAIFLALLSSTAYAETKKRTCGANPGQQLQHFLDELNAGDTLIVSGTCNESVVLGEGARNLTIDGQGTATINGSGNPNAPAVQIRGRGITLKGFTITGGRHAVQVQRSGSAFIDTNTIRNAAVHGVIVNDNAFVRVVDNTIEQNGAHGICVCEHSSAEIGFRGDFSATASPNVVRNNGGFGILIDSGSYAEMESNTVQQNVSGGVGVSDGSSARIGIQAGVVGTFAGANTIELNGARGVLVTRSSMARVVGNVIRNNATDGVGVFRVSQADVASNAIDGNGAHGVNVSQNSGVNLGNDVGSAPQDQPNSTAANNALFGVSCGLNSYADGRQGTLNGNLGPQSFSPNCVNSLAP